MRILHVVGARPNFMKAAPVITALNLYDGVSQALAHTGQHYDANMSEVFFRQLGLPEPHVNLEVGSGSHAQQTAQIMARFEPVLLDRRPDLVLVYGDVNSTVATALVCSKLGVRVGHVEAGLRSFDRTMPEEINRLLTDQLADLLFTPSADADENLLHEGIPQERIRLVGNVMIDTLVRLLPMARWPEGLEVPERYVLVTLHRPSNVDEPEMLRQIIAALTDIARDIPVLFPIHPRTRQRLGDFGVELSRASGLTLLDPVGYLEFLALQRDADVVVTDSGGIQEETTFLGVPCLTMRKNTERPVTVSLGTNRLIGQDMQRLQSAVHDVLTSGVVPRQAPPLWDGRAAERIATELVEMTEVRS
jgi:UDP-N-acetylglucosamine 2-epimerase (non-hydrolysing)